jgi:hypothetical protein
MALQKAITVGPINNGNHPGNPWKIESLGHFSILLVFSVCRCISAIRQIKIGFMLPFS